MKKEYDCPGCGEFVNIDELDNDGYCKDCNQKVREKHKNYGIK